MKKVLLILAAMVMCVSIAFASGSEEASSTPADWRTGTLTIYTSSNQSQLDYVMPAFEEMYPDLNVVLVPGSAGEIVARMRAEAAAPQADVLWGGVTYDEIEQNKEYFEPYQTDNIDEYPLFAVDKTGYLTPTSVQIPVLVVNTDLEKELGIEINGYADLLNPVLKGRIIHSNPTSSSSAWRNYVNQIMAFGGFNEDGTISDSAMEYLKAFIDNLDGVMTNSSSTVYRSVLNGEYVVGLSYESGITPLLADGATNIKMVYAEEGVIGFMNGISLIKNCPNPEAGKAFLNYLTSVEYQKLYSEWGGRPTHPDVEVGEFLKPLDEIKFLDYDGTKVGAAADYLREVWQDLWASAN